MSVLSSPSPRPSPVGRGSHLSRAEYPTRPTLLPRDSRFHLSLRERDGVRRKATSNRPRPEFLLAPPTIQRPPRGRGIAATPTPPPLPARLLPRTAFRAD